MERWQPMDCRQQANHHLSTASLRPTSTEPQSFPALLHVMISVLSTQSRPPRSHQTRSAGGTQLALQHSRFLKA